MGFSRDDDDRQKIAPRGAPLFLLTQTFQFVGDPTKVSRSLSVVVPKSRLESGVSPVRNVSPFHLLHGERLVITSSSSSSSSSIVGIGLHRSLQPGRASSEDSSSSSPSASTSSSSSSSSSESNPRPQEPPEQRARSSPRRRSIRVGLLVVGVLLLFIVRIDLHLLRRRGSRSRSSRSSLLLRHLVLVGVLLLHPPLPRPLRLPRNRPPPPHHHHHRCR